MRFASLHILFLTYSLHDFAHIYFILVYTLSILQLSIISIYLVASY